MPETSSPAPDAPRPWSRRRRTCASCSTTPPRRERRPDLRHLSMEGRNYALVAHCTKGIVRVGDALRRRDPRHRRPLLRQRHHLLQRRQPRPRINELRVRRQRRSAALPAAYQSSACIKIHHGSLTVIDSYFHDNRWDAIWCDTLRYGVIDIRDSRFSHNGRAGFTWEVSGDTTPGDHAFLQGNTFLANGWNPNEPFGCEATPASSSPTPPTLRSPATPSKATSPSTAPAPAPSSCTTAHATHNQCTTSRSTTTPSTTTESKVTHRSADLQHALSNPNPQAASIGGTRLSRLREPSEHRAQCQPAGGLSKSRPGLAERR